MGMADKECAMTEKLSDRIVLPPPTRTGAPLHESLEGRRSVREYTDSPLPPNDAADLLWAAQGAIGDGSARTAPSAGATYPLTAWLVAGRVKGLAPGVYRYDQGRHELSLWTALAKTVAVALAESRMK